MGTLCNFLILTTGCYAARLLRRKQELKKGIEFSAAAESRFPGKVSQVKCHQ